MLFAAAGSVQAICEPVFDSSRIAVAGGSITEILYLLGAEERIVAVDTTSTYPATARALPSVGYVRALSTEGLLSMRPTLVLGEEDMGPPEVLAQLERIGLPMVAIDEEHTAEGIMRKIRCVARILGLSQKADALILDTLAPLTVELDRARGRAGWQPLAVLILDARSGTLVAAGKETSGQAFLRMIGARNLFSDISGWKPVSPETILSARPDFVIFSRPGADITASEASSFAFAGGTNVVAVDTVETLGFGPRTIKAALDLLVKLQGRAQPDE